MSTQRASSLLGHFHGKIASAVLWRWASVSPPAAHHRPRRYFTPEMNHGTKGECTPRNPITAPSATGDKEDSVSWFSLSLPLQGQTSQEEEKPNAILRQMASESKFDFLRIDNSFVTEDAPVCLEIIISFPNAQTHVLKLRGTPLLLCQNMSCYKRKKIHHEQHTRAGAVDRVL